MTPSRKSTVRPRTGVKRVTVTLQLHPTNDADILEFLREAGNKQATIKDVIRACIHGANPRSGDTSDLTSLMQEMRSYLDRRFDEVSRQIKSASIIPAIETHSKQDDLSSELKAAIMGGFKPGKKSSL